MEYQNHPADPVDYLPHPVQPYCTGCDRTPEEIEEYILAAYEESMMGCENCSPEPHKGGEGGCECECHDITPTKWVRREEGTLNPANGHFLCDTCYIKAGMPVGPSGHRWIAP